MTRRQLNEPPARARPSRFIAISIDGVVSVHAVGVAHGNYATLCGLDGDDRHPFVQQRPAALPKRAKIDCPACQEVILAARNYNSLDFAK